MPTNSYDGAVQEEKQQGIILRAVPYQDDHHVVSAFTKERGVIRLFIRGSLRSRRSSHAMCTPLVLAELVVREKEGGLASLRDGHVIDPHTGLRSSYAKLDAAGQMAQSLLALLWPGKPAPALFALFARYLKELETSDHPNSLLVSFLCKTLKHEGLWVAPITCTQCSAPLTDCVVVRSETFCPKCAPVEGVDLGDEERKGLVVLTDARRLAEVTVGVPDTLPKKVVLIFKSTL